MTSDDQYRAKGVEFFTKASAATDPRLQVEYAAMAECYFRLAILAEKNRKTNIVYEPPPDPSDETA